MAWTVGEFVHHRWPAQYAAAHSAQAQSGGHVRDSNAGQLHQRHQGERDADLRSLAPASGVMNPVLTAADVTDYGNVDFVADPFMFVSGTGNWHMFFEVFNRNREPTAAIGHAYSNDAGQSWQYTGIVLQTEHHLAFPYVFQANDAYYMIPEQWNRQSPASITLYRTDSLPNGWSPISVITTPDQFLSDCVVYRWNDRWWALAGSDNERYELFGYYSSELETNEWHSHVENPIISGRPAAARPGGRPIVSEEDLIVFFQDCVAQYGDSVRAFEVETLSPTAYRDQELSWSPILQSSNKCIGWNSGSMHHIDPWWTGNGWRCAVDGNIGFGKQFFSRDHWAIGIYETPLQS